MNIEDLGSALSFKRAACLAANLPRESRVIQISHPALRWDDITRFISAIEYEMRQLLWSKTKDAQHGMNKPQPPIPPEKRDSLERRAESADPLDVARQLGLLKESEEV